jgi:predicted dinucleotide-binding enzyme
MDIVILGSGNVAAVLGRKFKAAGHTILQVISRNASAASNLLMSGIQKAPIIQVLPSPTQIFILLL